MWFCMWFSSLANDDVICVVTLWYCTESEQDSEPKDEISLEELKKEEEVKDEENESQTSENT